MQQEEENRHEEATEGMPAEASERPTVPEGRADKGKGKVTEEQADDFVSEEAHHLYKSTRRYYRTDTEVPVGTFRSLPYSFLYSYSLFRVLSYNV